MFSTKKQINIFSNKLFTNVNNSKIKFKFSSDKLLTFNEGDIVFKKGDKSNNLYLILEGKVKIKVPNPPFAPKIIFKYKNDFFGEKELLENKSRKSSCVAERACRLYPISKTELNKLISESNEVKENLEMVTITSEGKTLKEITRESQESTDEKEKTDFNKAIKIHPEKPITDVIAGKTKEKELTIENIFKTDKIKTNENIFTNETVKLKQEDLPEVLDKQEEQKINEIPGVPLPEKIIEREEGPITADKYLQIITAGHSLLKKLNDVDDLTQEIVKNAPELVNADRSIFFFVNKEDKMLEARIKDDENAATDLKIPLHNSISGHCALNNKIAVINDVSADEKFNPTFDEVFNYKTKNMLVVPIHDENENVTAILEIINSKEGNFTETDVEVIKIFSKSIRLALSNYGNIKNLISEAKEKALTNVSQYIYNDIKSPLQTIKHYSKILIKDKLPEEIKEVLQLIIKQTDFIDSINDNLSSLNEKKAKLSLKVVSFKETINDILNLLVEYSDSRNVVLFRKIDVQAKVKMDPKQFLVACYQIIKNACDAQPNKGSVYINSTLIDGKVNIEFKDSGKGVPVDMQKQIFTEFTSLKDDKNIGIGLNIADKIIKEHGGNITVSNSSEGGAVFTISLPVINE